ncbi:DnaD domain protein [Clostridium sp. MD294]|uniref:DnaD domain protein n=1 Tax=Clostridium sp. MD294 TaxID=97138 RepID=UPI0003A0994C|nr:DnaD domain protein [Clostridium sp. MD294]
MAFSVELPKSQTTQISNIFIEEYMPKAQPSFVTVYLYAYCHISSGDTSLTNQSIAEALDILESDVIKSWRYWQEQGIVKLLKDNTAHFLPVKSKKEQKTITQKNTYTTSPQYTQKEMIAIVKNSSTAQRLFSLAENYLARTLSYKDMNIIISFHEWLKLSLEVIELLFTYCTKNNHYDLRYIEQVAVGWSNEGITTPDKAIEYIHLHENGYKQILKTLGITGRMITPAEEKYIKKWTSEYHFHIEMILTACEKTILQTGGNGNMFKYADTILKDWHDKNIKTIEDVEISDKNFQSSKIQNQNTKSKATNSKQNKNATIKQNRFVNYKQREWDFEELERLARERLKKS